MWPTSVTSMYGVELSWSPPIILYFTPRDMWSLDQWKIALSDFFLNSFFLDGDGKPTITKYQHITFYFHLYTVLFLNNLKKKEISFPIFERKKIIISHCSKYFYFQEQKKYKEW